MPATADDMVVLGRIVEPYGLRGWLKVHFFGDDVAALGSMPQWWLAPASDAPASAWVAHELQALRPHGKGMIARLAGIDDRTAAEGLDGSYVAAPRVALPVTAKNEYYWADLIGLAVVNVQGERLGVVDSLMSSGAHDVLCVREDGKEAEATGRERLLPFVATVVKGVDREARAIRVEWGADW